MDTTQTLLPETIHVVTVNRYIYGSQPEIIFASLTEEEVDQFPGWNHGITGTFTARRVVTPSKRIRTIHEQGGILGFCADGIEIGAWLPGGGHHPGAYTYNERRGPRWTWTRAEFAYLSALLATRGKLTDYVKNLLEVHTQK